jgi:hypothetical protein
MQGTYEYLRELQYQIKLGGSFFPIYPVRSLAQAFYELRKALGIHGSAYHNISIKPVQYMKDHFIIGTDLERILDACFTGLNSKAAGMITINISGANQAINASQTFDKLYCTLQYDFYT